MAERKHTGKQGASGANKRPSVTGLGPYERQDVLAVGGGGTVWTARRLGETGERLVIKQAAAGLEAALRTEWRALHEVPSPLLPEPVAWLQPAGAQPPALVLRRRPGRPLDEALAGASPEHVAAVARAALRGLGALHAAGLVHGDLHPGNLLVDDAAGPTPQVSLLDLGLAQAPGTPVAGPGRPEYAAPDRLRGGAADPRDDLFSLGMALWRAWGLPAPYADYPAVLPPASARPLLPGAPADDAGQALVQQLARWLAPEREHRPAHAELALRQWPATDDRSEIEALADDVQALGQRPWRWRRWPGAAALPELPAAGRALWLVGPAGSGRTGVLVALADAVRQQQGAVAWLRPAAAGISPLDEAWADAALQTGVAPPAGSGAGPAPVDADPLSDRRGADVARWRSRLEPLLHALGPAGLLAVEDAEALPWGLQQALAGLEGDARAARLAVAVETLPCEGLETWPLPAVTADEVAAALQAAAGGRTWDAAVVRLLAGATGPNRREVGVLAADLLRTGAVVPCPDRVETVLEGAALARAVQQRVAARRSWTLPAADALPVCAHVLLAGRCFPGRPGEPLPAAALRVAGLTSTLRLLPGGGLGVADAGAAAFLRDHLPHAVLAAAARARAAADEGTPAAVALAVQAAGWDGGALPAAAEVSRAVADLLDAGEAGDAAELASAWLARTEDAAVAHADVAASALRARVALGAFAEADGDLAAWPAALRTATPVRLAEAELAFRRGDYPRCRQLADAVLFAGQDAPERLQARLWQAFAATWQGDRDGARTTVAAARALAAAGPIARLFDYLAALGDYYEGRLEGAEVGFRALEATTHGSLRAAAVGGLGLVAHRRGDLPAARAAYDRARQLAEEAGDRPRALNMAMNAAVLDHEAGDLGRALQGYDRVVLAARRLGNPGALSRALNNRGNLLALLGSDERAVADLAEALAAIEAAGNAYLAGNVCCVLAELERRAGRPQAARQHLTRAEADLRAAGAESELLEIRLESGHAALAAGDGARARAIAGEVHEAALRLGSAELQARARWLQAQGGLDADPTATASAADLRAALDGLQAAQELAPASKPLLQAGIAADRARALAWSGDVGAARALAADHLARLDAMAATLPVAERAAFQRAAAHLPTRTVLRLLAGLPEAPRGIAGAGLGGAIGALVTLNRRLSEEHDLGHLLELLMDAAVLLTGAERGFLLLEDEADDDADASRKRKPGVSKPELRVAVARNLDRENLRKPGHKLSHTIALRVFEAGDRVLATDAQADERFADQASIHAGSLRSILCVPLRCQGRAIGVLYVDNRFTAGAFSPDHAGVLEALADQAAIAIQTARLLARQRATAEALQRSRAEVEALNARLAEQLAEARSDLVTARADLDAQRHELARRSDYSQIKGNSPLLHRLFVLMDRVRDHDFPVLVHGESGTGKELVARAIHFTGRRKRAPFVAVNCAALPSNLLESELFGHARGAFTGAVAERRGLFESAHGGTLLLDEVGEMPLEMQAKLLRVLQTGELSRVGDSAVRKVDVRVVAATHRDLAAMVRDGRFREDLLYRLRVVELEIPPLRRRVDDIPLLVEYFLGENRKAGIGAVDRCGAAALQRLQKYAWPGNVRQLETVLKSACLFADGPVLQPADLEPLLRREHPGEPTGGGGDGADPAWLATATLDEIQLRVVKARIEAHGGNKRRAAETLGVDRGTLYNKLRAGDRT